jgi:hypothetical protein
MHGDEVQGHVHSENASGGVQVPIYDAGSVTARTIQSHEYLVVTDVTIVSVPGGDVHLFVGADATPGTGETVERGTVAANGGIVQGYTTPFTGIKGGKPFIVAPNGVVDVQVRGYLMRA